MFSLLVAVVVGAIVGGSFAGVGYTLWHQTQKAAGPDLPSPKTTLPSPPSIASDKTSRQAARNHGTQNKPAAVVTAPASPTAEEIAEALRKKIGSIPPI